MTGTPGLRTQQESPQCHSREVDHAFELIDLHQQDPKRYPHLLQSTANGRYDILFAFPGDSLVLGADGQLSRPDTSETGGSDFLAAVDGWWRQERIAGPCGNELPFNGGWFVYLGYELAGQIEPCLQLPASHGDLPIAMATRFQSAVIRDNERQCVTVVAENAAETLLDDILEDIRGLSHPSTVTVAVAEARETEPQAYLDAVARIHDYIREGDVFQVNLSRRWDITLEQPVEAAVLFRKLAQHNPSPFAGLASWPGLAVISSSPERLVSVHDGLAETRPIAGTRPRDRVTATDQAYSKELLAHPKERAEHIMLIDLERNDLGRVCMPGSIEVNELMVLESYAHVHHIVSNVRGRLRKDVTPGEVIRAVFPGGTITGCPKVRCMEIIAELEQQPRGAYTGSMGYINRDGSMDLNILIRTLVCQGAQLQLRAGAGIVADSDACAELEETRDKARGVLRALGLDDA